jgi:hypothetical protein
VLLTLAETRRANQRADVRALEAQAETRRANENAHVRELYVQAVKLLSDPDRSIRLGGLYALERVAGDSPGAQPTVVEVLSAFVRGRSADPAPRPDLPAGEAGSRPRPGRRDADVRAAVQVLGRLPRLDGVRRADLYGATLAGRASLAELDLTGADLTDVWLGGADLSHARLAGATLTGAVLGNQADLTFADLRLATLTGAELGRTDLNGARLGGADVRGVNFSSTRNLTTEQMEGSGEGGLRADRHTLEPAGVSRPTSWPDYAPGRRPAPN